ncbi:AraC family transcriptional regulator [Anoxybacillus geothermalis]|uniref:AraC family transcriptional regulator n=1 Tax=unclassified Geobacillus TaxID=2642459 RepID=UPI000C293084|nr:MULTISPECIES: AraC family transcriptional regulator [unclassified Geobacillus]MED0655310.1 AraC family transcriptional regulator [Anoxybacillus geothermalis]NNU99285.1 AraC family transcriptional regulator [Geobacillus sp. DSP4a]PJW15264.1 AraC family transcriptional regulator [Geobacillus sp. Manikaran-105]
MDYITFSLPPLPVFIKGAESVFPKGKRHFRRTFTVFDLLYVKQGCLYMTENGREFAIGSGQYLLLIPGREHYGHRPCEEKTELVWLHFLLPDYTVAPDCPASRQTVMEKEATYTEPIQYRLSIRQYGELKQRERAEQLLAQLVEPNVERDMDRPLRQLLLFVEFLWHLQKQELSVPSAAEQVSAAAVAYIERHFNEPITLEMLAKGLRFHPDYITRCMQKTMGMGFSRYLTYYRLSKAKQWLAETNETVEAVAKRVGIDDGAYFSRVFKKMEGMTPTEYRRMARRT